MAITTKMFRRAPLARKVTIVRLLMGTGVARLLLVDTPVFLARGLIAVPNKSGLARLYLSHKMRRGGGGVGLAVLTLSAVGMGAGAGYLAKSLRSR